LCAGAFAWWSPDAVATVIDGVETAEVTRGEFVDLLSLRGEVKARRSMVIGAPSGAGELQIVSLARAGAELKTGDVIVQFDPTTLQRTLAEKQSGLRQAEAEIEKARAQARLDEEAILTERAKAQYDVERARLDVGTREVISRIDAAKADIVLKDAEQKLREVDARVAAERAGARAEVRALEQKRDKARADVALDERGLTMLTVRAPIDGLVVLGRNWRAGPMNPREWRAGDRAWPGATIGELPELGAPYVLLKIDEIDRGRLDVGLQATVVVEALPGVDLPGRLTSFSTLARPDFSSWPPQRMFDLAVDLDTPDERLRPGMTAAVKVALARIPNALLVPSRAVMRVDGASTVYVAGRGGFEPRRVTVQRRGQDQVAIASGLEDGERVALDDPTRVAPRGGR
jgi:RND family efflux transporter MFP subunit